MAIYRILRGLLSDKTFKPVKLREEPIDEKTGLRGERRHVENLFYPGDIIETDKDLDKRNRSGPRRVERLPETFVKDDPSRQYVDLERLSVPKLRKHAAAEEIDLGTATSKEEIVNTIRSAMQEA